MFRRLGWYWRCCWGLVTPVGLAAILCYSLASYQPVAYNKLQLPLVAQVTTCLKSVHKNICTL